MTHATTATHRRLILPVVLALAILALGGCDKKPAASPATQVAVKVNDAEITVHQVNQVLAKMGNIPPDQQDQVRKSALDKLINQQLLASKAVANKLDRTPDTLMAIEAAKLEILARAYMETIVAAGPKLNSGDAPRYYFDHPELFSERKIYNLQEIVFQASEEGLKQVKALTASAASTEKIVEFMKSKNIPYRGNAATKPAEQLPMEVLKQLHAAKDGETLIISGPQGHTLVRVVATRKVPVDEATALPLIQRFLMNQRINETVEKEIKGLRDSAKIEYVGTFAAAPKTGAAPAANTPAQAAAPTAPPANGPTTESAPASGLTQSGSGPLKLPPLPHEGPNVGGIPVQNMEK